MIDLRQMVTNLFANCSEPGWDGNPDTPPISKEVYNSAIDYVNKLSEEEKEVVESVYATNGTIKLKLKDTTEEIDLGTVVREEPAGAKKGVSITPEIIAKQKRLGATGFSISNGEITFIVPPEVKARQEWAKAKKKKARKTANKSKKQNRR